MRYSHWPLRFLKQALVREQIIAKGPDADRQRFEARRDAILRKHEHNVELHQLQDRRDIPE